VIVLKYPQYSPDYAPCSFFSLKNNIWQSRNEFEWDIFPLLKGIVKEDYVEALAKFIKHLKLCFTVFAFLLIF
jgi:hypothetical protein